MTNTVIIDVGAIGADWAYLGSKNAATFAQHKVSHATRYVTRGNSSKALGAIERDRLHAAGVAITLCWETSATAAFGGAPQGRTDGLEAARQCGLLGYPTACPILAAVDTDVVASNSVLVNQYLRAFYAASSPYGPGLYGDEDAYALVADLAPVWCLPNALGWSPTLRRWFSGLLKLIGFGFKGHIRQGREDKTLGWDYPNTCTKPFAAWLPRADPVTPPTTPKPPTTVVIPPGSPAPILEDDMSNALYVSDAPAGDPAYYDAQFLAVVNAQGAALEVRWTGPGTPKVLARIAAHKAAGLQVIPVGRAGFINTVLLGPIPPGFTVNEFDDVRPNG